MQRLERVMATAVVGGLTILAACTGGPGTTTEIVSGSSGISLTSSGNGSSTSSGSSGSSTSSSGASSSSSSSSGGTGAPCRAQKDCTVSGDVCIGGNVPAGCGGAYIHQCDVSSDCPQDAGVKVCSLGACTGQNRCVDPQCSGPSDPSCGTNKVCTDRLCVAKPCTSDGQCVGGYCVNGVCSSTLGVCGKQAQYP